MPKRLQMNPSGHRKGSPVSAQPPVKVEVGAPIFRKSCITELINLQREGGKAKVYQVRQVRAVLLTYRLAGDGGED